MSEWKIEIKKNSIKVIHLCPNREYCGFGRSYFTGKNFIKEMYCSTCNTMLPESLLVAVKMMLKR